jgi:hypothetical protein
MNTLLEQLEQIPVWTQDNNGNLICTDINSGKVLSKKSKPTLKDGSNINVFNPYKAILVKDVEIYNEHLPGYIEAQNIIKLGKNKIKVKQTTEVYVGMMPNGKFFLAISDKNSSTIGDDIKIDDFSFL